MKEIVSGLWEIDEIGSMVHAYAWMWEKGVTLIDTGLPGNADVILEALAGQGIDPGRIQRIIVTHADLDHAGSLRELVRATGAAVASHTVEKFLLEHPTRRKTAPNLAGYAVYPLFRLASLLPPFRVEPVTPTELLVDGQRLEEGFVVVHTPGHTPGHISLHHPARRLFISGDAFQRWRGKLSGPPALFTPDRDNAERSIWKVARRLSSEIDCAVFGHGEPNTNNAGSEISALAQELFHEE